MSNDKLKLLGIKEALDKIEIYSNDFNEAEDFYHDSKSFDASMMQFVVIAEMIEKLSQEFKNSHNEVQWQKIKDFRNIIAHNYFGIDPDEIWDIIINKMKPLQIQINEYLI